MNKELSSLMITAAAICIAGFAAPAAYASETKCSLLSSKTVHICVTRNGETEVDACYLNTDKKSWRCERAEKSRATSPSPNVREALAKTRVGSVKTK